jgi:hypothetical protein
MGMNITPELKQQFALLAILDEDRLIGEFIIAMIEYSEDLHPDPEDMHPVVSSMFRYWTDTNRMRYVFPNWRGNDA